MAAVASLLLAPAFLAAQALPAKPVPPSAKAKTGLVSRTPDGQPDLQGYWTSLSFTPMERPAKYGGTEVLTDEGMDELFKAGLHHPYEFTYANSTNSPLSYSH